MDIYLNRLSGDEKELAELQINEDTENFTQKELEDYIEEVLKPGKIGWNHCSFSTMLSKEIEMDIYKQTKPEVEEGVLQCKKCGSKKVFSYQIQARSADEPMTTIAKCSQCGIGWTENN